MLRRLPSPASGPVRPRGTGGFTLIELMVTVAVLGLMLLAALPTIRDWMVNTEIRNATEAIANGLSRARAEAVKRNQEVIFSLVTDNAQGVVDGSCALTSRSASWVISLDDPAGQCDSPIGTDDASAQAPRLLARHGRSDGSPGVRVEVRDATCASTSGQTQVVFNGYGRLESRTTDPVRCLVVSHPSSETARILRVMLDLGGTVRTCDPAVTRDDDPRACRSRTST